ncbi:MAG: hypothetical protein COU31_05205 [Candidatus Magasanikbacteria bacterium CG10_big_fil_rev_8_21_14_0_10_40_10]|uniref:Uncharacterized protein n=1 Tax=Candidatus Magasanikbacteria bacterium CG10_big_fil_rev_8_21_14_0_10_40_10 TaxID=1974648 RepID=A0A2M6W2N8_9BACT|nr:MAG: hypothetical protein COU31_05205 [Candidatus Magasanikbacteria bacterium CG10_big_fil_rev_8_21_14_0_10_40_10]
MSETNFLTKYKKKYESEKAGRGENTQVIVSLTRHEDPLKTPEGMSSDKITDEGLKKAKKTGQKETTPYILLYGSHSVKRARETGQAFAEGIDSNVDLENMAEIINKKIKKGSKTIAGEFGVYAMPDLDPIGKLGVVLKPYLNEAQEKISRKELEESQKLTYAIQKFLDTPDKKFEEWNAETPRQAAARLAHYLNIVGIKQSGRLFSEFKLKAKSITHCPAIESLLKFVLKDKNKVGFKDLSEIGGATTPGESIDFDIQRDENGELKPITIKMRGKEMEMDMEKFNELLREYKAVKK